MPNLYIIAGCNGAGKTTSSLTLLPEILNCKEFINADTIASGLSAFQPEKVAFEAGRIMLLRINQLVKEKADFAFETTLAAKSYAGLVKDCRSSGYNVILIFFWLESVALAKQRVSIRVNKGGHNIEDEVIERRYLRGLSNLNNIYLDLCDEWLIFDNSEEIPRLVASGGCNQELLILNNTTWNLIRKVKPSS